MRRSTATQVAQFPTVGGFILWLLSNLYGVVPDCREISIWQSTATQQTTWHRWRSSRLSGDFYAAVHSYLEIYMAQFPTVGKFTYGGPWLLRDLYGAIPDCRGILYGGPQLLSNLHGAVPDCRGISMRRSTATQQFTWRSSRLSGDLYTAVHSYSAICMAQFPTVGRFICGGPQLLSNLHGPVLDCREIYMRRSTATQQFVWRSSRLSGDLHYVYSAICMARFLTVRRFILWLLSNLYGAVPDCRGISMWWSTATQQFVMAQFPTVGRFILWLLSNLYGAVPDCREIYMWQSTATQ